MLGNSCQLSRTLYTQDILSEFEFFLWPVQSQQRFTTSNIFKKAFFLTVFEHFTKPLRSHMDALTFITVHPNWAVFSWVPKVIWRLLWFCLTSLSDWLAKRCATFSTNQEKKQNQSCLARTRFPALGAGYMYLVRVLIGWLCCLHLLWLARVITGFGFSTENRSNWTSMLCRTG